MDKFNKKEVSYSEMRISELKKEIKSLQRKKEYDNIPSLQYQITQYRKTMGDIKYSLKNVDKCRCGSTEGVYLRVNPYKYEMYGNCDKEYLCDDCYDDCRGDI